MGPVKLKDVALGEGRTKVIVPITGRTEAELLQQASALAAHDLDVVEWRVDFFEGAVAADAVLRAAHARHRNGQPPAPQHVLLAQALTSAMAAAGHDGDMPKPWMPQHDCDEIPMLPLAEAARRLGLSKRPSSDRLPDSSCRATSPMLKWPSTIRGSRASTLSRWYPSVRI